MKRMMVMALVIMSSLLIFALSPSAHASTAYGSLNNFDCVNDTGVEAHGFEIELDDVRSADITYTYDCDPNGDQVAILVTGVTQNEPVNGLGDGDTSPDAVLQGDKVLLRSERGGNGDGRVYRVNFTAIDGQGGECNGSVNVSFPKSMHPGNRAVDDGQRYNSTLR